VVLYPQPYGDAALGRAKLVFPHVLKQLPGARGGGGNRGSANTRTLALRGFFWISFVALFFEVDRVGFVIRQALPPTRRARRRAAPHPPSDETKAPHPQSHPAPVSANPGANDAPHTSWTHETGRAEKGKITTADVSADTLRTQALVTAELPVTAHTLDARAREGGRRRS